MLVFLIFEFTLQIIKIMISSISIYPNSLPYIFGENHTEINLNFGGQYFSQIEYNESDPYDYSATLEINENYIENLFGKIHLVSAIVGKNGAGKTTLLKTIRDSDLNGIDNDGKEVSTTNYLKIYYTPFLSYDPENNIKDTVLNISKYSQISEELRHDQVGLNEMLEIHHSEFLKNLFKLHKRESLYYRLIELGLPDINFVKVKLLKLKDDDWNISRAFLQFFRELDNIKNKEVQTLEQLELDRLNLTEVDEIRTNDEFNLLKYRIRLKAEIINCVILKIKQILDYSGNKYLSEGYVNGNVSEMIEQESYKEAFYWFLDNAYIKPTSNSDPILLPVDEIKSFTESLIGIIDKQENYKNWTEFYIPRENAIEFLDLFQNFIFSFRKYFTYEDYPILELSTNIQLSTGEQTMFELFSQLNQIAFNIGNNIYVDYQGRNKFNEINDYIILLDEADIAFHPTWKKKYVNLLIEIIPEIFQDKNLQIIFTTHDPLALSDLPADNIIFLDKNSDGFTELSTNFNKNTFGANISELLAESFFIHDGLMGDFAKNKIEEIIAWINVNKKTKRRNEDYYEKLSFYKKIIEIIDERILKIKLSEMISELEGDSEFQKRVISNEINLLNNKLENL